MANFLIVASVAVASAVVAVVLDVGAFYLIGGRFVDGKGSEAALAWFRVFLFSLAISAAIGLAVGVFGGIAFVRGRNGSPRDQSQCQCGGEGCDCSRDGACVLVQRIDGKYACFQNEQRSTDDAADDYSAKPFNRAAIRWLTALAAEQDHHTFAGSTELLAAERELAPWLLTYRAISKETAKNIAGFSVWVERVPVVGTDQPALVVHHDPERLPDLE